MKTPPRHPSTARKGSVPPVHALIGVGISALCLFIAFRRVDIPSFVVSLRSADYRWLFLYPILCVALNLVRGEVWRILLKRQCSLASTFWAYTVGFLFNNVLPFRVGEAARIVVLARHRRIAVAEVAATAILERILDLSAVLIVLACTLPVVGIGRGAVWYGALTAIGVVGIVLAGIVVLACFGASLERAVGRISAVAGAALGAAIVRRWREVVDGSTRLLRPGIGLPAAGGILVVWALTVLAQWTVLRAFQPHASFVESAFMVAVISLAIAVPAAPGFIGVYQWAGQQALAGAFPDMYTPASGLAIAITAHAVSYVCSTLLGVIGLWYFGASFTLGSELQGQAAVVETETA